MSLEVSRCAAPLPPMGRRASFNRHGPALPTHATTASPSNLLLQYAGGTNHRLCICLTLKQGPSFDFWGHGLISYRSLFDIDLQCALVSVQHVGDRNNSRAHSNDDPLMVVE